MPLKRNRKTPLTDSDVVRATKYTFLEDLRKVVVIFARNDNRTSLFYMLKAMQLQFLYLCSA